MKRRTKILLVIRQLILGGAESQTYELAKRLDREKFEVVVCALQEDGYFASKLAAEGIPVRVVAKRWRYDFSIVPRLVSLFKQERPDIVHCVMWTANMWSGLAALLARAPRLILSTRSIGIWKTSLHYLTGPLIFNRASVVLANSVEVRNYMVEHEGIRPEKIRIVYNGLDLDEFGKKPSQKEIARARQELGCPSDRHVVGIVANLSPQKDYPTFLRAAARVAGMRQDVHFLIVGDGPARPMVEMEIARLALIPRVTLAGQRSDVARCLACMDIFVLSSIREGFSNALLEAMAMGLPVIATRVGGNIDAVQEGVSGFLFEVGEDEALAQLILKLIDDPQQSRLLGENGKQRVAGDFSMPACIATMESLYGELLEDGPA